MAYASRCPSGAFPLSPYTTPDAVEIRAPYLTPGNISLRLDPRSHEQGLVVGDLLAQSGASHQVLANLRCVLNRIGVASNIIGCTSVQLVSRPDRDIHLLDEIDFLSAIDNGTLPSVSYFKPAGVHTQHPAYTNLEAGDEHVDQILKKLKTSKQWEHMLIVVTYDENGGYWDHVPPPRGAGWSDEFGPGTRVPAILIGPHVKKGHVDSTTLDTTSILKFVTDRFQLRPLPGVREKVGNLSTALE